ncbi:MAG: tyrosine--tRNA ligase, partial [Alphaproteobacteria bacterium]|nr:tyrosine--tRNA ligase [Alphaproteobacteria bacterium]
LRLFTTLPLEEVERLERRGGAGINEAKKVLANEATRLAHGEEAAAAAAETARRTFEEGTTGEALPSITVPRSELAQGVGLLDAMRRAGLVPSNGEARRMIKGGGVRVNDRPVADEGRVLSEADLEGGLIKISAGKKRHALVRPD